MKTKNFRSLSSFVFALFCNFHSEMDEHMIEALRKSRIFLLDNVIIDELLDHVIAQDIFSNSMLEYIKVGIIIIRLIVSTLSTYFLVQSFTVHICTQSDLSGQGSIVLQTRHSSFRSRCQEFYSSHNGLSGQR